MILQRLSALLLMMAICLGAGVAVVGCGDDGNGSGSTAAGAEASAGPDEEFGSKQEFVAAAAEICEEDRKEIREELETRFESMPTGEDQKEAIESLVIDFVVPTFEAQVQELRALGEPPAGGAAEVEKVLAAIEKVTRQASQEPARFANSEQPFAESERIADSYGLTACGQV